MAEPDYKLNRSVIVHHRRHLLKRLGYFGLCFALLVCIAGLVGYKIINKASKTDKNIFYSATIAGPQTFSTPYFQFSDTENWMYEQSQSNTTKYVFSLNNGDSPPDKLDVYIDYTPDQSDLATARVLPVSIINMDTFKEGSLSANCSTLYSSVSDTQIKTLSIAGTTMVCNPNTSDDSIVVGQLGQDYNLILKRRNNSVASYIIIFHNTSLGPDPSPFMRIMKTFKAV